MCAVTGEELILTEMDCHHKTLWSVTKDDSYSNLVLITRDVHRLVHSTESEIIQKYIRLLNLNKEQLVKINKLRLLIGNKAITNGDY
jgi:hypothetical protein